MKLGLVFGSVIFLIAGITLADSSLEVSGQSDRERQKILEAASNAAANATADLMKKAENVLRLASNATNVTELEPNASPDLSTDNFPNPDPDEGTGYYPPPYTYAQCLGVFNKEMCDFRFNR